MPNIIKTIKPDDKDFNKELAPESDVDMLISISDCAG
jgi:hypothetical protein